jgi:Flp pilus assembly protein TadD
MSFSIRGRRIEILISLGLLASTLIVFAPASRYNFVSHDDPTYVSGNAALQKGLTLDGITWALTTFHAANWHPVTWLSILVEYQLGGLNPHIYHTTNVLLHAVNAVMLFLALRVLTGAVWRSSLVAALFGLHPLHVESVAWISERKDVLSTFFGLLTLIAYGWYVRKGHWDRYLLLVLLFVLGLMAKPMLVTLPCILLLLDYWPLRRTEGLDRLLLEKLPLFVLSAGSCLLTWQAQRAGMAIQSGESFPVSVRFENAVAAYDQYVLKTFWPTRLAIFYPHPGHDLSWQEIGPGLLLLTGVTVLVSWMARSRPYLPVGWLWFVGTLVPVIGLVQVGKQGWADRYSYIPLIGLFIMLAWALGELAGRSRNLVVVGTIGTLAILAVMSYHQVGYWRDSLTLWQHALEAAPESALAHYSLGNALLKQGQVAQAAHEFRETVRMDPGNAEAHNNLGVILRDVARVSEAVTEFRKAAELSPSSTSIRANLAEALQATGNLKEAVEQWRVAIEREPGRVDLCGSLGTCLLQEGAIAEAIAVFRNALEMDPTSARTHCNLGQALLEVGEFHEALVHLKRGDELGSQDRDWHYPSTQWIHDCEKEIQLDSKLSDVLVGKQTIASAAERLAFADLAFRKRQFELAATFYEEAFAQDPALAEDLRGNHRYKAGCSAALAQRRRKAFDWLHADLRQRAQVIMSAPPSVRLAVVQSLVRWKLDPNLAGVRDPEQLMRLSPGEAKEWANLWRELDSLTEPD